MQQLKLPLIDAPVEDLGSSFVLICDSEGFRKDPVDWKIEMALRKAFEALAASLRASIAASLFTRASVLWIQVVMDP